VRGGLVWSHLLASILGGLVVAGVLLAFGVIGKQRTETVPVQYSSTPPASASGSGANSDTAQIYLNDGPGVVHITARILHRTTSPFVAGAEPAGSRVIGSGFLISRQGFILTTFHQIQGADFSKGISVEFNAQTTRRAEVIQYKAQYDVALLKVNMHGVSQQIPALQMGNSRQVSVGASVLAIANPYGLERTLASGIVSSLQRELVGAHGVGVNDVLQTDLAASPGTDGSPLMDDVGDVIGINSQIEVTSGGRTYPVAFAMPINTVTSSMTGIVPKGVLP
jgi:S1-C subfamily serine protease